MPLIRPTTERSEWVILADGPTTASIERPASWRQPPEHTRKRAVRGVSRVGRAVVVPPGSEQFRRTAEESFGRSRIIPRLLGIAFDPSRGLSVEDAERLAQRAAVVRITLD